jgi:NAD(P)H dehydrogenase (quinone)
MTVDPKDIRHLVVLAHPAHESFNRSIAMEYCDAVTDSGQTAILRDLYAMDFDPRLRANERPDITGFEMSPAIEHELSLIRDCAVITMVYPLWFGMPPAMIKGYIDRVLGAGFEARDIKRNRTNPLLRGKHFLILSSSASTRPWLEERGQWNALHQAFETYLSAIFGFASTDHLHFDAIVPGCDRDYVGENLYDTRLRAREICAAVLSAQHAEQMRTLL